MVPMWCLMRHIFSVFWIVAFLSCFGCTVYLTWSNWQRFENNPTVISIDRIKRGSNVTYPASYVCPLEKGNDTVIATVAERIAKENGGDVKRIKLYLKALANLSYDSMNNMKDFEGDKNLPQTELLNLVKKIRFKLDFNPLTLLMTPGQKIKAGMNVSMEVPYDTYKNRRLNNMIAPFPYKLVEIITERGICFAHNSMFSSLMSIDKEHSISEEKPELLKRNSLEKPIQLFLGAVNSDYALSFTSSNEIPDVIHKNTTINKNYRYNIDYTAIILYSSQLTRTLPIKYRKCQFPEESDLFISPMYSYNLCRIQCRIKLSLELCGCVPYFYSIFVNVTVCGIKGMICLAAHTEVLITLDSRKGKLKEKVDCHCYQNCDIDNYIQGIQSVLTHINSPNDQGIGWIISQFPPHRQRKDVIFTYTNLLGSFGGVISLFLGASLLSIVELLYYCTLRLLFYIRDAGKISLQQHY